MSGKTIYYISRLCTKVNPSAPHNPSKGAMGRGCNIPFTLKPHHFFVQITQILQDTE